MAMNPYGLKDGIRVFQDLYGGTIRLPGLPSEDGCDLTGRDEHTRREAQRLATPSTWTLGSVRPSLRTAERAERV